MTVLGPVEQGPLELIPSLGFVQVSIDHQFQVDGRMALTPRMAGPNSFTAAVIWVGYRTVGSGTGQGMRRSLLRGHPEAPANLRDRRGRYDPFEPSGLFEVFVR